MGKEEATLLEKLERAIRNRPSNWVVERDSQGKLVTACDRSNGNLFFEDANDGWQAIN